MKRQAGFTLIELLVAIVCSTVVTAAALSVLLLGVRTQRQSQEVTGTQMETRVLLSVLEKTLSSGEATGVAVTDEGWTLTGRDSNQPTLMQYSIKEKEIKSGAGAVLLDDVQNAIADYDGTLRLLRLTITNGSGDTYTLTKRCTATPTGISGVEKKNGEGSKVTWELITGTGKSKTEIKRQDDAGDSDNRLAFLNTLAGQVGSNGMILGESSETDKWYATWYNSSFTKDTPWCACFLSWAISENRGALKFADVADGIVQLGSNWHPKTGNGYSISKAVPGDLIFFDWDGDGNANHVGALLLKDGDRIYTIEGNSGGMVAVRYYSSKDARIMGYGVLDWKTN